MENHLQEYITLTLSDGRIEEIPYIQGMGPYRIAEYWACKQQLTAHQQREIRKQLEKHPRTTEKLGPAIPSAQWNEVNFDLAEFRSNLEAALIKNLGSSPKKLKKPNRTRVVPYQEASLKQLKQAVKQLKSQKNSGLFWSPHKQ